MKTMNISLPARMKAFIDEQIDTGEYGSASEYVRKLVRDEQRRVARERLEQLLLDGLDSGPPTKLTARDWERIRATAHAAAKRKKRRA